MGPPVRALKLGQLFNHCGLSPQRRRMRPVAFDPKRTSSLRPLSGMAHFLDWLLNGWETTSWKKAGALRGSFDYAQRSEAEPLVRAFVPTVPAAGPKAPRRMDFAIQP